MIMPPARRPADQDPVRAAVAARYAGLALAAHQGRAITDGGSDADPADCFGSAAYPDAGGLPDGAVRASLGCGNPVAVADLAHLPGHRFVATTAGQVAGWVAASAVSGRRVYAGVVEHSLYVHPAARCPLPAARAPAAASWMR
jgi:hypothetical protein